MATIRITLNGSDFELTLERNDLQQSHIDAPVYRLNNGHIEKINIVHDEVITIYINLCLYFPFVKLLSVIN